MPSMISNCCCFAHTFFCVDPTSWGKKSILYLLLFLDWQQKLFLTESNGKLKIKFSYGRSNLRILSSLFWVTRNIRWQYAWRTWISSFSKIDFWELFCFFFVNFEAPISFYRFLFCFIASNKN